MDTKHTDSPSEAEQAAAPAASRGADAGFGPWARRTAVQLGKDLAFLLVGGPLAIIMFTLLITLASISVGTAIIWIGLPLGVVTLWLARWFAALERFRIESTQGVPIPAGYPEPRPARTRIGKWLRPLATPQYWRDLGYGILSFPLYIVSWSIALSWLAASLGGISIWFWGRWLPHDDTEFADPILNWITSLPGQTALGLIALITLPVVARGLVAAHVVVGQFALGPWGSKALRERIESLESASRSAAEAEASELRRIERDLHDGPQQRLIRVAMDVQSATRKLGDDAREAKEALNSALEHSQEALHELRALARGMAPPLLAERGLVAAVESLAERGSVPTKVTATVPDELPVAAETAAYFVVSEGLANVEKHAGATRASVSLTCAKGTLKVVVRDNGAGGASVAKGHGLAGLTDRVQGVGGTLTVTDAPKGGTVLTAEVPCE